MKITSIPQLARNANRVREIVTVVSKYGMADWLSRLGLQFAWGVFRSSGGQRLAAVTPEARIRLVLTELGTTFIKLGQILSTRADLVGAELARELTALQASAPADPPSVVRATVERELGKRIEDIFEEFEELPLASASIGQVHRARLKTGERVVIKVQHEGIEERVRADLDILTGLAELAEDHIPELRNYRPRAVAAEFQRILLRELDFRREERNLQQFARNFDGDQTIHFPRSYPELTTSRVLTMECLDGVKFSQLALLGLSDEERQEIARRGATAFLEMIFRDGMYHADPHPGNILLLKGNVIGLLDCGMVGRIDERMREDLEEVVISVTMRDAVHLTAMIIRVGLTPPDLDEGALSTDIAELLADYCNQPFDQVDLGGALMDITEVIRRHHVILPSSMSLLIKVLVMLDGTSRLLNPRFSLTELIQPFYQRLMWKQVSPTRQWQRLRRLYQDWEYLGRMLPRGLVGLVQQLQSGRFDVHLEHKRLEPSVNRLVFGLLTSSLFLGSALLWTHRVPPVIFESEVSIFGALGCILSFGLGLRLLWAIRKSGKLER